MSESAVRRAGAAPPERVEAHARKAAREELSLTAEATYEVIRREGEMELARSSGALAWSGLAAGLAMGFTLVAKGVLHAHLPEAPWRALVTPLGYAAGFLIVILASQQLFTENTLKPVVPYLARPTRAAFANVARLWVVVLLANLVGALLFAAVAARTGLFPADAREAFAETARAAVAHGFWISAIKAVFAGWLIALLVWMLPAAETSHVLVIVAISYLVGVGEFLHIITGSVDVFYLAWSGALGWGDTLTRFIVPVLIGNSVGGVVMVSLLNHAQVQPEGGEEE